MRVLHDDLNSFENYAYIVVVGVNHQFSWYYSMFRDCWEAIELYSFGIITSNQKFIFVESKSIQYAPSTQNIILN